MRYGMGSPISVALCILSPHQLPPFLIVEGMATFKCERHLVLPPSGTFFSTLFLCVKTLREPESDPFLQLNPIMTFNSPSSCPDGPYDRGFVDSRQFYSGSPSPLRGFKAMFASSTPQPVGHFGLRAPLSVPPIFRPEVHYSKGIHLVWVLSPS